MVEGVGFVGIFGSEKGGDVQQREDAAMVWTKIEHRDDEPHGFAESNLTFLISSQKRLWRWHWGFPCTFTIV